MPQGTDVTRYPVFDREELRLLPIAERGHDLLVEHMLPLERPSEPFASPDLEPFLDRVRRARANGRPVVVFYGGHVIKLGLSRYLIDLVERGWFTHLATNGAGLIHDFELATVGGTSENVARWIRRGQFGLWSETSALNDIVSEGAALDEGLGEAVGRRLVESAPPFADVSVAAAAYRHGVPLTVHVTVGADIVHAHPNCHGAAVGACSHQDFLILTASIAGLDGGMFVNMGSAVTGPEVYLKALSMARNVAHRHGGAIRDITTAVLDLVELPTDWRNGPAPKSDPAYYYRPWKTILLRTVADGGASFYLRGDHSVTLPTIWARLAGMERRSP